MELAGGERHPSRWRWTKKQNEGREWSSMMVAALPETHQNVVATADRGSVGPWRWLNNGGKLQWMGA